MLKILLLSLSRQYTVDGQFIPSLFIEPEVRHNKTSYMRDLTFSNNSFRNTIRVSKSLDPDLDGLSVGPDLDPN